MRIQHQHAIAAPRSRAIDALLVGAAAPVLAAAIVLHGALLFVVMLAASVVAALVAVAAVAAPFIAEVGRREGVVK